MVCIESSTRGLLGVNVHLDSTSTWANKNTTAVYGYKNAHHMFNMYSNHGN